MFYLVIGVPLDSRAQYTESGRNSWLFNAKNETHPRKRRYNSIVLSPKTKPELEDIFLMPEMPATLPFITAYAILGLHAAHVSCLNTSSSNFLTGYSIPSILALHSSKAIGKEATTIARRLGWASPHPGFGPQIELSSCDACGLFNLRGIGKTLSC